MNRVFKIVGFLGFYLYSLVRSNFIIAYDILTPKMKTNPGLIWVTLRVQTDMQILLFSNLLSMTPGTLSVVVAPDRSKILVHYMYNREGMDVEDEIEKLQGKIITTFA